MERGKPPAWLDAEAKAIFREVEPQIPGYIPVLDRAAVTMYAAALALLRRLEAEIADPATPEQKRQVLEGMLPDQRDMVYQGAEALGLTPGSRLMIERAQRAKGGDDEPRPAS